MNIFKKKRHSKGKRGRKSTRGQDPQMVKIPTRSVESDAAPASSSMFTRNETVNLDQNFTSTVEEGPTHTTSTLRRPRSKIRLNLRRKRSRTQREDPPALAPSIQDYKDASTGPSAAAHLSDQRDSRSLTASLARPIRKHLLGLSRGGKRKRQDILPDGNRDSAQSQLQVTGPDQARSQELSQPETNRSSSRPLKCAQSSAATLARESTDSSARVPAKKLGDHSSRRDEQVMVEPRIPSINAVQQAMRCSASEVSTAAAAEANNHAEIEDVTLAKEDVSNVSNTGVSASAARKTCPTLSPDSTPSVQSKARSLGQSWISQVSREMACVRSPQKSSFLMMFKEELAGNSLEKTAKEPASGGCPDVEKGPEVTSEITWACEDSEELTAACQSSVQPTPTRQSSQHLKGPRQTNKKTRVTVAKLMDNITEISDVPLLACSPFQRAHPPSRTRISAPRDSGGGGRCGESVLLLVLPVLVIPVLILLSFLIAFLLPRKPARNKTRLPDQLAAACSGNVACVRAVHAMADSMDLTADPCSEFERFTCGNWRARNPRRSSYRREMMRTYTRRIHEALLLRISAPSGSLARRSHHEANGGTSNMAAFYGSCLAFLEASAQQNATVTDVINAMRLHPCREAPGNESAEQTAFQGLLEFIVTTSFRSGLASVASVSSRGGSTYLDMGETLNSTFGSVAVVEEFLNATYGDFTDDNYATCALQSLDHRAHKWRSQVNKSSPFVPTTLGELRPTFPNITWEHALNSMGDGRAYQSFSVVYTRGMREVSEVMALLSKDSLQRACVYASTVLLAQVMKYAYIFWGDWANNRTFVERVETCLGVAGSFFKDLLPRWIATALIPNGTADALRDTVEKLKHGALHSPVYEDMAWINGSDFMALNVTVVGESRLTDIGGRQRTAPAPTDYSEQFLLNVVRASRDHVGVDYDEGAAERQLKGEISFFQLDGQPFVAVPANYLIADAFIGDESAASLDYASIGVRLLLDWVVDKTGPEAGTASQSTPLGRRVRCVRDSASALFGRQVGDEEGQLLVFADWALHVASMSAEAHRQNRIGDASAVGSAEEVVEDTALRTISRKLFYLRSCHTLCGEEGALAGACRFSTAHSRDFAEAFGCRLQRVTKC
ncbi:hypothetical protein HPB48_017879 [Haemaphysalis longicornis]|uniref:Peptidase M13 N-terminal domain-containing protein n=1 Tax=Haemaphysalis longicornis TaxID=44386 RepID=A0A9J6GMY9_HAELO|nr:hypothetical protein HPB48_017879 [Haemaphysalis longicornis]